MDGNERGNERVWLIVGLFLVFLTALCTIALFERMMNLL